MPMFSNNMLCGKVKSNLNPAASVGAVVVRDALPMTYHVSVMLMSPSTTQLVVNSATSAAAAAAASTTAASGLARSSSGAARTGRGDGAPLNDDSPGRE